MKKHQTGGTIIGLIVGVIIGLGAALAVAVYVTKVPVPFLNKGSGKGSDLDAAESEKNKNWDPNSPLYGKNPVRPVTPAAPDTAAPAEPQVSTAPPESKTVTARAETKADAKTDAKADAKTEAKADAKTKPDAKVESKPGADPLGDLAVAKAAASGNLDPFDYFVQAGAFRTQADADAQRAKLAMLGWQSRVSEREQSGRTVFRVRVGPFTKRDDAEQLKEKLDTAKVDAVLVRVQR